MIVINGTVFHRTQKLLITETSTAMSSRNLFSGSIVMPLLDAAGNPLPISVIEVTGIADIRSLEEDNEYIKISKLFDDDQTYVKIIYDESQDLHLYAIMIKLTYSMNSSAPFIMQWKATFLGSTESATIKQWGE